MYEYISGFYLNEQGKKLFIIDELESLSEYLSTEVINYYNLSEHNFKKQNLFHAKLSRKNIDLNNFLFESILNDLSNNEQDIIYAKLEKEIQQLFMSTN